MIVLADINEKGGVGKTITAVNLAVLWARKFRVLLIDLDAQYSATSFFLQEGAASNSTYNVLLENAPISEIAVPAKEGLPNLHIIPSGPAMETAARQLPDITAGDMRLSRALRHSVNDYDICILDSPSRYDAVTRNALMAGTHLLVPMNTERMAYNGALDTFRHANLIRSEYERPLLDYRVLITAYAGHFTNDRDIEDAALETWPGQVCTTRIRRTVKVASLSTKWNTVHDVAAGTGREDYTLASEELLPWIMPDQAQHYLKAA